MKHLLLLFAFVNLLTSLASSQTVILPKDSVLKNPFLRVKKAIASDDFVLLQEWRENNQSLLKLTVRKNADIQMNNPPAFQEESNVTYDVPGELFGNKNMAVQAIDIDNDNKDEIFYVIEGPGSVPELHGLKFNGDAFIHTSMQLEYTLNQNMMGTNSFGINPNLGKIELKAVDLEGDGNQEIVVAYLLGSSLLVNFYSLENFEGNFINLGTYLDTDITPVIWNWTTTEYWSICFDDFDYSGTPEMVVCGSSMSEASIVKVIRIDMNAAEPFETTCSWPAQTLSTTFFEVTTGDLNGDFIPEIITASYTETSNQINIFGVGKETASDPNYLSHIVLYRDSIGGFNNNFTTNPSNPIKTMDIAIGDINNDRYDDIVICDMIYTAVVYGNANIAAMTSTFGNATTSIFNYPPIPHPVNGSFLHLADLNNDGELQMIIVWNSYLSTTDLSWQDLRSWYFDIDSEPALQSNEVHRHVPYNGTADVQNGWKHVSCMADLSGDAYRVGTPLRYEFSNVVQPLIQLTPPPVHSDYDQNGNFYNAFDCLVGDCGFEARYEKQSETSINLKVERKSAWSVDASVGVEADFLGVEVSAKLNTSYGEGFSNIDDFTESFTESISVGTSYDDLVYCSVLSYDILRYPIMKGDSILRYLTSVIPKAENPNPYEWIPAKDEKLKNFLTTHEPGNIMSFRPIDAAAEFFPGDESIYVGPVRTISINTEYQETIAYQSMNETTAATSSEFSLGGAVSANIYGVSASIEGNFSMSQMKTSTAQIKEGFAFALGYPTEDAPDLQAGPVEMPYALQPAIKWNESGLGEISFLSRPTLTSFDTDNWWTLNYNKPDPALILPWLLDYERFGLLTTDKLRTKSIWMTNQQGVRIFNPSPGETVQIHTRVFNYGLQPIESIGVKFTIGHPEMENAIELMSTDNAEMAINTNQIEPQMFEEIVFEVVMPEADGVDCRLYAELITGNDPSEEVHTRNNIGYIQLGYNYTDCADIVLEVPEVKSKNQLVVYPNPSSGIFHIKGNASEKLEVNVYNISGQKILSQTIIANTLDLSSLPDGIYCVNVIGSTINETHRLIKQ